ncbi:MAG: nucleoside kinase [Planctomycetes bacterium]|nr:nucleoside kinase [Planctomycetota bacterium]
MSVVPGIRRSTVQAQLPDGCLFDAAPGTDLATIFRAAFPEPQLQPVAAIVNGALRELTFPLLIDSVVVPVTLQTSDGMRIYRRSLVFLMVTAAAEVFPGCEVFVNHAASSGGYFCTVRGRAPFNAAEVASLEARMRAIVVENAPITREVVPLQEAVEMFRKDGETDKAQLIARRPRPEFVLYSLHGHRDYFHGFMLPSTGYLGTFGLHAFPHGFRLQFPRQRKPRELPPIAPYPKLFAVFQESSAWLDRLGIRSVGALNEAIAAERLREIILVAEALHEKRIAEIAGQIAGRRGEVRVVLIAGPSASGKTTFSKRLAVQLLAHGLRPFPLALDDYFVERSRTPRDEEGNLDYEVLGALDVELFDEHLRRLTAGERVTLPAYDFKSGTRKDGETLALSREHVIVVEGIHGLNPALLPRFPIRHLHRIYVSALTTLNLDRHTRVSTTDTRLIRRIVRDAATRGYSATDTLSRWESVRRGERMNIFPYQENADAIFNSALPYEMAVLRPQAETLLLQVRPGTPEHIESNRLLSFLDWFHPAPPTLVPDNSLLREFVGGSILEDFRMWRGTPGPA